MRGKKAKALRAMVGYKPAVHRPELPKKVPTRAGKMFSRILGRNIDTDIPMTVVLPKEHPRRAYQFVKRRYGMLPLASLLSRLRAGFGHG